MSTFVSRLAARWTGRTSRDGQLPRSRRGRARRRRALPRLEALEAIQLLSGTVRLAHSPPAPITLPAQTATFPIRTITPPPNPIAPVQTATIPQFNPSLGRLISVSITASGSLSAVVLSENLNDQNSDTITATLTGNYDLFIPGMSAPATTQSRTFTTTPPATPNAAPFDGQADFAGADTVSFGGPAQNGVNAQPGLTIPDIPLAQTLTDPTSLALYTGTGTVGFGFTAIAAATATDTNANIQTQSTAASVGQVSVQYTYVPGAAAGQGTGSIAGFVYTDCMPEDGLRQPDEPGVPGVTLTLTGTTAAGPIAPVTTTTAADGSYSFTGLDAGTYTVTETVPAGFLPNLATKGNVTPIPGSDQTHAIPGIVVVDNGSATDNDFGLLTPSSITGFVYFDANGNGIKDNTATEVGLPGVTVFLAGVNDLGQGVPLMSTVTDATGAYSFTGLRPGTYTTVEMPPAGFAVGQTTRGNVTPLPNSLGTGAIPGIVAPVCGIASQNNFAARPQGPEGQMLGGCILVTPRIFGIHQDPTPIVLTFDTPLTPALAQNVANYQLVALSPNSRSVIGNARPIAIRSATYDPVANTVTLMPAARLSLNHYFEVTVKAAVAGPAMGFRDPLDPSTVCGDYTAIIGRGTHIHFNDTDGDLVTFGVSKGGVLELDRAPDGSARRLLVLNGVPFQDLLNPSTSFVQGSVTKARNGDGLARIPEIDGAGKVQLRLPQPPFVIGTINNADLPPANLPGHNTPRPSTVKAKAQPASRHA
jgi:hypothetical protein